ncbi:DUF6153 family protein [Microbispora catharanthi]|uniref:Uncharacterized protein n=1 Tax=Microbispora catharanthi TaxID=1712871 RepID=A0A5N6BUQ4_9ACTN|nr:DUF6153 family protein [Microbispora catharanthi]KAB8184033.1 hypothetical protein FH610_016965 [Microbispora catharanthi]
MLLMILVTGVAAMHTLGHEHDGPGAMSMSAAMTTHTADVGLATPHHSSSGSDSSTHNAGSHSPFDPSTVCLAILSALGLALGLPLFLTRMGAEEAARPGRLSIGRFSVPDLPPLSVVLTRVVVLRN